MLKLITSLYELQGPDKFVHNVQWQYTIMASNRHPYPTTVYHLVFDKTDPLNFGENYYTRVVDWESSKVWKQSGLLCEGIRRGFSLWLGNQDASKLLLRFKNDTIFYGHMQWKTKDKDDNQLRIIMLAIIS